MSRVVVQPALTVVRNSQSVNRIVALNTFNTIRTGHTNDVIVKTENIMNLLTVGTQGPVGPAGPAGLGGEEDMVYAKRFDFEDDGATVYEGNADPGTDDGDAFWRIKKTTFINEQDDATVEWADGNADFDNIWNNRLGLSYS